MGLQLRTGMSGYAGAKFGGEPSGNYAPLTPASATAASASTTTIGSKAYGISGDGTTTDDYCGVTSVIVSVGAALLLAYIYYTLPR